MIQTFQITGGAAADPDPRAAPATIPPDRILSAGERIVETDEQPASLALALEGTASNTCQVTLWHSYDDPHAVNPLNQRWYLLTAAAITVTVGQVIRAPILPGRTYIRVTVASAADSVLKARVLSQPYATPVA